MTDRTRLIELLASVKPPINVKNVQGSYDTIGETRLGNNDIEHIADHLLANGVIVPPCKVGDKAYIIENPYTFLPLKKVVEGDVMSVHQHEHGLFIRVLFDTKKINGCADYNLDWRLNKAVFLTKEEAEKALAERIGK